MIVVIIGLLFRLFLVRVGIIIIIILLAWYVRVLVGGRLILFIMRLSLRYGLVRLGIRSLRLSNLSVFVEWDDDVYCCYWGRYCGFCECSAVPVRV